MHFPEHKTCQLYCNKSKPQKNQRLLVFSLFLKAHVLGTEQGSVPCEGSFWHCVCMISLLKYFISYFKDPMLLCGTMRKTVWSAKTLPVVNLPHAESSVENSYGRYKTSSSITQSQSVIHKVYFGPKCHPPSNLPYHEHYTGWASSFPTLSDMTPGWTVICTMFLIHRSHISIKLVNVLYANSPITVPWFPQWILISTGRGRKGGCTDPGDRLPFALT